VKGGPSGESFYLAPMNVDDTPSVISMVVPLRLSDLACGLADLQGDT